MQRRKTLPTAVSYTHLDVYKRQIPDNIKNKLEIIPVKWIDQVLELALERLPVALPEEETTPAVGAGSENASAQSIVTH